MQIHTMQIQPSDQSPVTKVHRSSNGISISDSNITTISSIISSSSSIISTISASIGTSSTISASIGTISTSIGTSSTISTSIGTSSTISTSIGTISTSIGTSSTNCSNGSGSSYGQPLPLPQQQLAECMQCSLSLPSWLVKSMATVQTAEPPAPSRCLSGRKAAHSEHPLCITLCNTLVAFVECIC